MCPVRTTRRLIPVVPAVQVQPNQSTNEPASYTKRQVHLPPPPPPGPQHTPSGYHPPCPHTTPTTCFSLDTPVEHNKYPFSVPIAQTPHVPRTVRLSCPVSTYSAALRLPKPLPLAVPRPLPAPVVPAAAAVTPLTPPLGPAAEAPLLGEAQEAARSVAASVGRRLPVASCLSCVCGCGARTGTERGKVRGC